MSKAQKLKEKLMSGQQDRNFSFDDAIAVLLREGFLRDGGKGSHQVYRHKDGRKVVLPFHGKDLKPVYIRTIRELLR